LISSMMIAVFGAFMLESADKRIRTSTRVADLTHLPNLAYVPLAPLHKGSPPTPFHYTIRQQQSTYAEAMRSLYLACWLTNIDDPPQVIMFNSALPGEGKTTMALSLGAVAAAQNKRVAVVDLDLHRGGIANALNLDMTDVDLADYLRGKCSIEDITLTDVEIEGLDIIPVRPRTNRPSVLLDSVRARQLIDSLRAHYDLIILDTPPVLAVSDTAWLSQFVDAAVLVLRWGTSTEDALQEALARLHMSRAPLLGTVINMVDPRVQARHDYGGPLKYAEQAKSYYVN
jgi:capsular exopolysaccharide synthesis family protein